jgi:type I restriction enzyme S subunit
MALSIITTTKSELILCESHRLDSKYYFVNSVFYELAKKSLCEVKTLDELGVKISSGSYIDTYFNKNEGVPYIRVGNIKPFTIDESNKSLVYVSNNVPSKIKVRKNDIIMGRTQATVEKLGVASIVDKGNENFAISQHISKITADETIVSPFYLIGYLNSKFYKAQTALATHGDTRVEMTHSQLRKIKIFLPEKEVMKSIEVKVQTIIDNNRSSIEKINRAKKILKTKLNIESKNTNKFFSERISVLQDFGIWNAASYLPKYREQESALKKKFRTIRLGTIASMTKGVEAGSENYKTDLFAKSEDYAFIRTSDITNNEIDIFPDYFIARDLAVLLNHNAVEGDIVFSKDGTIGETAIISKHDKVIVASGFAQIKLKPEAKKENITKEYLFVVLSLEETGFNPAWRRTVIASTIPHLREARLKEIEIPILDKDSIDEITKLIKEAFKLKDEKKRLIKEVKEEIDSYFNVGK